MLVDHLASAKAVARIQENDKILYFSILPELFLLVKESSFSCMPYRMHSVAEKSSLSQIKVLRTWDTMWFTLVEDKVNVTMRKLNNKSQNQNLNYIVDVDTRNPQKQNPKTIIASIQNSKFKALTKLFRPRRSSVEVLDARQLGRRPSPRNGDGDHAALVCEHDVLALHRSE